MNYKEVLAYLYQQLPMYQRIGKAAYKADLENTLSLDQYLGHPHRKFRSVHIAGTNGKGSVSHILAAVLHESGCKVGLYTSPHLKDFRERIRVDGIPVPESRVIEFTLSHKSYFAKISPSFFEMTVAMAFSYFAESEVDIAIIETGMGGRLDSTNIIDPMISVITNIGMDHSQFLGDTLQKIAMEKAGIIKESTPLIIGETQPGLKELFIEVAGKRNTSICFADNHYAVDSAMMDLNFKPRLSVSREGKMWLDNLSTDLLGSYQDRNIVTALKCLEMLGGFGYVVEESGIRAGLSDITGKTGLRGRWQVLGREPLVVADMAHNADGLATVVEQIRNTPFRDLHMVIGMVSDKDVKDILQLLPPDAHYYFTQATIPRALDYIILQDTAKELGLAGSGHPSVSGAYEAARSAAGSNDMIFIGGSTFVVAEVI